MPDPAPYRHVVRVAALFAFGALAFVAARHLLMPSDFGRLGFYRAGALDEIKALPVRYAGHETCEVCHSAVIEARGETKHAKLSCEVCHGPQQDHAINVQPLPTKIADVRVLCLRCHATLAGKPAGFPHVDTATHPTGTCTSCHKPHSPELPKSKSATAKEKAGHGF